MNAASVAPGICGSFTKSQRLIFLSCFHDRNVLFLLLLCGAHSHVFVPLISLIIRKQTVAYRILTDPGGSWELYKTVFISSFMAAYSSVFFTVTVVGVHIKHGFMAYVIPVSQRFGIHTAPIVLFQTFFSTLGSV